MSSSSLKQQGAVQDQTLRKRSLSEGSDSSPCKEPICRSTCAPSAGHRPHFCCLLPMSLLGVSPSHEAWALLRPLPGLWQWAVVSMDAGNAAFPHSKWDTPFSSHVPGYTSLMPTNPPSSDKAPHGWQPAHCPAEWAPTHLPVRGSFSQ